ncbi:MAG TPA: ribonuclease P protein component [Candidatus Coprenecus stercoravium]|uniref:Ribonuclease P protein component n=1 Tax=Candidatus Coprenecus stercoravium TaxID=2840735 RepID=A0A9D2GNM1_9BACT|nr:ribonuclease P protein component [Candidatus Coprenecus stercoravium]
MTRTERIHSQGSRINAYPYRLYVLDNAEGEDGCVVISVPKKLFKRAVKRNLIRRRTREALRHSRADYPSMENKGIIMVYIADKVLDYGQITEGLRSALAKIQ